MYACDPTARAKLSRQTYVTLRDLALPYVTLPYANSTLRYLTRPYVILRDLTLPYMTLLDDFFTKNMIGYVRSPDGVQSPPRRSPDIDFYP